MARSHILVAGIIVTGIFHAAPALASDEPGRSVPVALPDAIASDPARDRSPQPQFGSEAPFAGADVVDEAKLADVTGLADVNVIEQAANVRNTSTISGNIINGDPTTGTISFDGGSFGAFNGLALVSANTGNNVSINSAMNVNVAIQ